MQKATEAEKRMHSICNNKFVLTSALIDTYQKYGELINIVQRVNSLPYERYDAFNHACEKMKEMHERVSHGECNEKSCRWPSYDKDLKILNDTGEYMGAPICHQYAGLNLSQGPLLYQAPQVPMKMP